MDVLVCQSLSQRSRKDTVFPTSLLSSSSALSCIYSPLLSPPTSLPFLSSIFLFFSLVPLLTHLNLLHLLNRLRLLGMSTVFLYLYFSGHWFEFLWDWAEASVRIQLEEWRGLEGPGFVLLVLESRLPWALYREELNVDPTIWKIWHYFFPKATQGAGREDKWLVFPNTIASNSRNVLSRFLTLEWFNLVLKVPEGEWDGLIWRCCEKIPIAFRFHVTAQACT